MTASPNSGKRVHLLYEKAARIAYDNVLKIDRKPGNQDLHAIGRTVKGDWSMITS